MKKIVSLAMALLCAVVIVGCGNKDNDLGQSEIAVKNTINENVTFSDSENSIPVIINFINISGIKIGMLSIIDPGAHEQLNIAALENDSSMNVEINWPKEEDAISWALYNEKGELCIEGTSDLTGMSEGATIVFGGDGNVTNVDVEVD